MKNKDNLAFTLNLLRPFALVDAMSKALDISKYMMFWLCTHVDE